MSSVVKKMGPDKGRIESGKDTEMGAAPILLRRHSHI